VDDDLENLRRVIRLIEEMDAYFAKLESPPFESPQPVDRGFPQRRRGRLGRGAGNTLHASLSRGINFTDAALTYQGSFQRKAYFLFTFDVDSPENVKNKPGIIPQEIRIEGGPLGLRPTVLQCRQSSNSLYNVDYIDGRPKLLYRGLPFAEVDFVPKHAYYDFRLKDGTPVETIAPAIYWGQTVDVTAFRTCQDWGGEGGVQVLRHK